MEPSRPQNFVDQWAWLCPFAMTLAAAAVMMAFGLSFWSSLLIALLLVCPALIVWSAIKVRRHSPP